MTDETYQTHDNLTVVIKHMPNEALKATYSMARAMVSEWKTVAKTCPESPTIGTIVDKWSTIMVQLRTEVKNRGLNK